MRLEISQIKYTPVAYSRNQWYNSAQGWISLSPPHRPDRPPRLCGYPPMCSCASYSYRLSIATCRVVCYGGWCLSSVERLWWRYRWRGGRAVIRISDTPARITLEGCAVQVLQSHYYWLVMFLELLLCWFCCHYCFCYQGMVLL